MSKLKEWLAEQKEKRAKHALIKKKAKAVEDEEYYKAKEQHEINEARKRAVVRAKQPGGFARITQGLQGVGTQLSKSPKRKSSMDGMNILFGPPPKKGRGKQPSIVDMI